MDSLRSWVLNAMMLTALFGIVSCGAAEQIDDVIDPGDAENCDRLQERWGARFEDLAAELLAAGGDVHGPECVQYDRFFSVDAYFDASQAPVEVAGLEYSESDFDADERECIVGPEGGQITALQLGGQIAVFVSGSTYELDCD